MDGGMEGWREGGREGGRCDRGRGKVEGARAVGIREPAPRRCVWVCVECRREGEIGGSSCLREARAGPAEAGGHVWGSGLEGGRGWVVPVLDALRRREPAGPARRSCPPTRPCWHYAPMRASSVRPSPALPLAASPSPLVDSGPGGETISRARGRGKCKAARENKRGEKEKALGVEIHRHIDRDR
jgi:hypothetical protein